MLVSCFTLPILAFTDQLRRYTRWKTKIRYTLGGGKRTLNCVIDKAEIQGQSPFTVDNRLQHLRPMPCTMQIHVKWAGFLSYHLLEDVGELKLYKMLRIVTSISIQRSLMILMDGNIVCVYRSPSKIEYHDKGRTRIIVLSHRSVQDRYNSLRSTKFYQEVRNLFHRNLRSRTGMLLAGLQVRVEQGFMMLWINGGQVGGMIYVDVLNEFPNTKAPLRHGIGGM